MMNINTNEISSLESTLESPKKTTPNNDINNNKKNIFTVHYEDEQQKFELNKKKNNRRHKNKKRNRFTKLKKKNYFNEPNIKYKNNEINLLDFDLLLKDIIEPKIEKSPSLKKSKNKSIKKLLHKKRKFGSKTKKNTINKSKYILFYY